MKKTSTYIGSLLVILLALGWSSLQAQTTDPYTADGGSLTPPGTTSGVVSFPITVDDLCGTIGTNYDIDQLVMTGVQHTFAADLDIRLISPNGTIVELSLDNGGSTGLDDGGCTIAFAEGGDSPDNWTSSTSAVNPCDGDVLDPALEDPTELAMTGGLVNFDGDNVNGTWTLEITDDAGGDTGSFNNVSLTFDIINADCPTDPCENDTTPPVVTCPPGATTDCDNIPTGLTSAADFIAAGGTISDDCTTSLADFTVSSMDAVAGDVCPTTAQQVITRTYTIIDDSGNPATCTQSITIQNSVVGPIITAIPLNANVECVEDAVLDLAAFTFDTDCGLGSTLTGSAATILGAPNCPGTQINYTYTAIDDCGRMASHVQTYTIINDGPTVEVPAEALSISCCDEDTDDLIAAFYADVTTTVSCGLTTTVTATPALEDLDVACEANTMVTFAISDACGRTAEATRMISFTPPEVNLSVISEINRTLNEDCQALLTPRQVLVGDWDVDGDGVEPQDKQFNIVVQDSDPSNGPIIDGCGTFIYTVDNMPSGEVDEGLEGVLDPFGSNWFFGTISFDPADGTQVGVFVDVPNQEINLQTLGNFDLDAFILVGDYTFSEAGTISMDLTFNDADPGFDFGYSIYSFEGDLTTAPIIVYGDGSSAGLGMGPLSSMISEEGVPGSVLRIGLFDDGFAPINPGISTVTMSNLRFERAAPGVTIAGFENGWGYVNAEDKTSPVLDDELNAPEPLYCDAIDAVDISQIPSSVSRCWIQSGDDGTTINNSMSPILRGRLLAGGGIPNFTDGCSDVEICVNDIVVNTGACNDVVLTRTFTARDGLNCDAVSGEENAPAVYSYDITFTRPTLDDVEGVDPDAIFNCDDQLTLLPANQFGDENPAPDADDFPFFAGPNGPIYLGANFCNMGATFTDGPRIVTCPQTYKFVRTFTVIDWCDTDDILSFPQLVKVGDFEAPEIEAPTQDLDFNGEADLGPLFFSTSNPDCSANFIIPAGDAEDNCDPNPGVIAFILPNGNGGVAALGPFAVGGAALNIPVGEHVLRYIATDACDNSDTLDVDIAVGDRTAPVAICEDGLDISVGGANSAILRPEDIDRASYDECSDIYREIAFVNENDMVVGGWQEYIELTCADIGIVRVALRVTDDGNNDGIFQPGIDNSNVCWLNVLVEDKVGPICVAPALVTTTCDDEDVNNLPQDLTAAFDADPVSVGAQLDAIFGAGNGVDNCPDPTVEQDVLDLRNSCGVGTIIRTFVVTDGAGFTSPPGCQQTITVLGVHDYTIVFPADAGSDECIEPDYNGITYDERACDLLTVTTDIDTFTASADECYKLRITYEVLNWCEYNTEEDGYLVPRDADGDDILEERTWLHVLPNNTSTTFDDVAWLDRDGNRFNGFISPLDLHDPNGQVFGSSTEPYGTDESRGAFIYRQFIKVYDDVAPEITTVTPDGPFNDDDGDCAAPVELGFSIADECTDVDAYDATVELDAFFQDLDDDGVLTLADFVANTEAILQPVVTANGDGTFTVDFNVDLPLGTHAIRITATDGCGNADIDLIIFEVADNKAPTPICINGLTATLMPDGNGGGMAAIWASEYIASEATDCNGPVEYAIYRAATAAVDGFAPMVGDTGLELTCDDLGMLAVRVYAIDAGGQADYCETTLFVQAFQEGVCAGGDGGSILGSITTPADNGVANVEVSISGDMNDMIMTNNDGDFAFTDLAIGDDYTVAPALDVDVDVATAVTTYDILLTNRHILAIQELASPYQHVVADVTMDGDINVLDVVHMRMVIMGTTSSFPNAPSWRFANAEYDFGGDASSWAGASFDEVFNANNLPGDMLGADFVALEMGNVSAGAIVGEARSAAALETSNLELVAGNTYEVAFTAADLYGFQGTLELAAGLELVGVDYGQVSASNLNLDGAAAGLVVVSYDEVAGTTEEVLFSLNVRATVNAPLSSLLSITDRVAVAQAYPTSGGVANLNINFGAGVTEAGFALEQNSPNPVADRTQIAYTLVEAGAVTLELRDVQGRTVLVRQLDGAAGYNVVELSRADLGATGVLSYTLTAGDQTATRKMIVVQ